MIMPVQTLTKTDLYKMGSFDNGGRYYLDDTFQTESSKGLRSPSRQWPLSVWKHCQTIKFRKSMTREQCDMVGVEYLGE